MLSLKLLLSLYIKKYILSKKLQFEVSCLHENKYNVLYILILLDITTHLIQCIQLEQN